MKAIELGSKKNKKTAPGALTPEAVDGGDRFDGHITL